MAEPVTRPLTKPLPLASARAVPGSPAERPGRGTRIPARAQIMCWLVLVMTCGLATVVLLVIEFEYDAVEDRVNRSLEQDAAEFRTFAAAGVDPATGRPIQNPEVLFRRHLATQYTGDSELLLGVTDLGNRLGLVRQSSEAWQEVPLDEPVLDRIVRSDEGSGVVGTQAGPLRWLRVDVAAQPEAWFVAGYFTDSTEAEADSTVRTLIGVSVVALVLGAGVSYLVAGQILAPVRTVRNAAAQLTEHDLTHRIPVRGRDDIAALAEQFNAMLDRLEKAFGTHRQFLDDAGHELRTPITIVRGHLEVMGDDPAERAEVVRLCTDELDRMARIVDELLLLAKAERPDFVRPEWTSVPELTSDIEAKARAIADREWMLDAVGEGEAFVDPQRVTQAVLQLAQNAVQYSEPGSTVRLGSAVHRGAVSFWVTDSGPGVSEQDAPRIFDRFTRGAAGTSERTGAGLGLAIVKAIADAHHGRVRVLSAPGQGATFGIELPVSPHYQLTAEVTG